MILVAAALIAQMTSNPRVQLAGNVIRLNQIAHVHGGSSQVGETIIARLPDGAGRFELSREQLKTLAIRAVPGLEVDQRGEGTITFTRALPVSTSTQCFEAASAVPAGATVRSADMIAAACDGLRASKKLRFDPASDALIAQEAIPAGTYLGAVRPTKGPQVRRGETLSLRAQTGPVHIERPVVAMQAGRSADHRIFVRTDDGQVFPVDLAVEAAQ